MTDDVHHKRLALAAADAAVPVARSVLHTQEQELRWYYLADHVLTISEQDKQSILQSLLRSRAIHEAHFSTVRHVYSDTVLYSLDMRSPYVHRSGLLFVGNLNNPTNLFGLQWFMYTVWPILRRTSARITLQIVGDMGSDYVARSGLAKLLRNASGVQVTGYVADHQLGEILQKARLLIVPIRWATGILTKQVRYTLSILQ